MTTELFPSRRERAIRAQLERADLDAIARMELSSAPSLEAKCAEAVTQAEAARTRLGCK